MLPVFRRSHPIIFLENLPEIPGIHIPQLLRNGRDGKLRIHQQPCGLLHFQLLDILAEAHSGAAPNDSLDLPLAVIEEIRQLFQRDRRIIFLHIFQNEYYIFIMPLGVRLRHDHVGAVVAEQDDKKRTHDVIQENQRSPDPRPCGKTGKGEFSNDTAYV